MKVTALHVKHALMSYFRYKRGWLCATEFECMDVVALDGQDIHEVEVKISKWDLWNGEAKKRGKHVPDVTRDWPYRMCSFRPNRFSVAVPMALMEEADKWVESVNPKYGIILFKAECPATDITIRRTAKRLRPAQGVNWAPKVAMRVCSENVGLMGRLLENEGGFR